MFQKLQTIKPFIQSRLSRKLALGIFTSIVLIEIALLIPLALRRQQELLTQIQQSTLASATLATRALPPDLSEAELLEQLADRFQDIALGGSLQNQTTGAWVGQFGESPGFFSGQAQQWKGLYEGDRYDIPLSLPPHQAQTYRLILRQDASSVQREVTGFILLAASLMAISALGATGATMMMLGITVITPMLKLRQNLLAMGQAVSQGNLPPAFVPLETLPNHELGEVMVAFQQLSGQVFAAMLERQTRERHLQAANEQLEARLMKQTQALDEQNQVLIQTLVKLEAAQEAVIQPNAKIALGEWVAAIAQELNTSLAAMQVAAGGIVHNLKRLPEILPQFWQDLTPEEQTQWLELVTQVTQPQAPLSARDRRQSRKQLAAQLQQEGISNPRTVAERCLDLGIQDCYQQYLPLLASPAHAELRQFVQQTCHLHQQSRAILTAVGQTSKTIFALKSYAQLKLNEERQAVDLTVLIYKALSLYPSQFSHGVKVTRLYDPLPPLWCYPNALTQVWANLLHNAFQAMAGEGEITITARVEGDFAVVSVADSGPGIPEAIQARIFEPFFTTRPPGEGSGLGLAMCQQVIAQHGGDLEMTSQPGATVFTVRLPLEPAP